MKATRIRDHKGEVPSTELILKLEKLLLKEMKAHGYISGVEIKTRTEIKIGLHMCSFRIDTQIHGHNADYSHVGRMCKAGYKRTSIPTWSQREDFNHMVNRCFNKLKLSAKIVSGPFLVRSHETGEIINWSSHDAYCGGTRLFQIEKLV